MDAAWASLRPGLESALGAALEDAEKDVVEDVTMPAVLRAVAANLNAQADAMSAQLAPLLSAHDDSGMAFSIDSATSYCAEDAYTRLARDIVVFTPDHKFLVKKWGGGGHRAVASHGNAFGTFFYRPPKDIPPSAGAIKFSSPMWEGETKGWLLTFSIDGLSPPKNKELSNMFGPESKEAMLDAALNSEAKCFVMPSMSQSDKSSIAAPMTVLMNFIPHEEISLEAFPDYAWASMEQALDPLGNVHAGVIASFCLETGIASAQQLAQLGWTEEEMLVRIKLPPALSTLGDLGTDVASIYTSVKGLVLAEHRKGRLPAQLPRRTC